jgi:hypothetical protein
VVYWIGKHALKLKVRRVKGVVFAAPNGKEPRITMLDNDTKNWKKHTQKDGEMSVSLRSW